jgi:phospholipid/cholesterol/gamma-HCH transport system substrate-binding protein
VITKRTKMQLMVFVLITLLGVSYVGARYAQLDRLVMDDSYRVTARFADSGGIFEGAEVTYRGVTVGRVGKMELTDEGVDVHLDIDNGEDDIPADTRAVVGNRSAVGEQYVELQPESNGRPYLEEGAEIEQSRTAIPISSSKWLTDTQRLVNSVDRQDLRTVVREFGTAFADGGADLERLIDTSSSFIDSANDNVELTTRLIRDSNTVLSTQLDKASAIRSFSRDLALLSDTLVASDPDLRRIIANGSATANTLRTFLEENQVDLGRLVNNLVTTNEMVIEHLPGVEMVLILYPYVVAGGYAVADDDNGRGVHNAHFGLILDEFEPLCEAGYDRGQRRDPETDRGNKPMDEDARCTEPIDRSNSRGAQHSPRRVAPGDVPTLASYDRESGEVTYLDGTEDTSGTVSYTGGAGAALGKESWKWLLLQPLSSR